MTVEVADDLASGATVTADVAVVGGGPAGLTAALDLAAAGADVVVLESGGRTQSERDRDRDLGDVVGTPFRFGGADMTLADVRIRALGGASGHWAGMCRPLDPVDLAVRSWVPGSGWPIARSDLDPFYEQAAQTLQLGDFGFDPPAWYQRCGTRQLLLDGPLETVVSQFSTPVMFGVEMAPRLEAADGPRVLLGATAVDATLAADRSRLSSLTIRTDSGATHQVVADAVVLAVGGYEVPRLLLSWDGERGVANSSGLVGRGFADHPHRSGGQVRALLGSETPALYSYGESPGDEPPVRVWAGWSPTAEVQEVERIGHGAVYLRFDDGPDHGRSDPSPVTDAVGPLVSWESGGSAAQWATVDVRTEQHRNDDSRITLGSTRDDTGLRRIRVDWRPTAEDAVTARRIVELFAAELGRAGVGRVEVDPRGRSLVDVPVEIGCHPMRSARMSADPSAGVVDADLRSHDVRNLYVCSSATFPTCGHANPTMTIVALAHRLAAHLSSG